LPSKRVWHDRIQSDALDLYSQVRNKVRVRDWQGLDDELEECARIDGGGCGAEVSVVAAVVAEAYDQAGLAIGSSLSGWLPGCRLGGRPEGRLLTERPRANSSNSKMHVGRCGEALGILESCSIALLHALVNAVPGLKHEKSADGLANAWSIDMQCSPRPCTRHTSPV
jgi:hypothetical protein